MPETTAPDPDRGIDLAAGPDGRLSTSALGRAVFAAAAGVVDPDLAARIEATRDWRKEYTAPLRDLVAAAVPVPDAAVPAARAGIDALLARSVFVRDGEPVPLAGGLPDPVAPYASARVTGDARPDPVLSVPYHGRRLAGDALREQLDRWVDHGITEPSFRDAMLLVLDNPDWLDLRGVDVALLGAGAEMGPLRSLLRWGATVHAVDLPRPALWERLIGTARSSAGTLRVPVPADRPAAAGAPDDVALAAVAGADVLARTPEVLAWLGEVEGPLTVGNYLYADGALHVRVSVAADAVMTALARSRPDTTLAFLATPTDAFAVPAEAVAESRRRWETRGLVGLAQAPLRMARLFQPNYAVTVTGPDGIERGINDSLVPQQGPNYALAKRFQRWRALEARASGTPVSLHIAPATRTRSVVKNRALAAAYAGAGRFGVEIFEPSTSNTLMAALLVHDLRNPGATAAPAAPMPPGTDLFAAAANHGGLWRVAYAPRSVLGVAALLGMFESRA